MPFRSRSLIIKGWMTVIYQIQFGRMLIIIMMKNPGTTNAKLLALPHSDASEERVFSMVKRHETLFRASMGFNTLGFILTVKLANPNATKFKPEKTPLNSAKSETSEYNKRHSSSSSSITTKNVEKRCHYSSSSYIFLFIYILLLL